MHGNAHLWCNINQALLWFQSINITENLFFFSESLKFYCSFHDTPGYTTCCLVFSTRPILCNDSNIMD